MVKVVNQRNSKRGKRMDTIFNKKKLPIGVFDSGLGGLSVLKALYQVLPNEDYIYYGDSANAPYGTRSDDEVYHLSKKIVEMFINKYHVKAIVIACNTATSAAAKRLRAQYDLPIIGLEPALKPAVEENPQSEILVMATSLTLKGNKFNEAMHHYLDKATIVKVPAPALVEDVEHGDLTSPKVYDYLHKLLDQYLKNNDVKAVVLGCTHFPFVQTAIQNVVGKDIKIYDGSFGVAHQLKNQLMKLDELNPNVQKGKIQLHNSNSNPGEIELSHKLLGL